MTGPKYVLRRRTRDHPALSIPAPILRSQSSGVVLTDAQTLSLVGTVDRLGSRGYSSGLCFLYLRRRVAQAKYSHDLASQYLLWRTGQGVGHAEGPVRLVQGF